MIRTHRSTILVCASLSLLVPCLVRAQETWFETGQDATLMLSGLGFDEAGGSDPIVFHHPSGIATDGTRLVVCDRFNNRVLVWNAMPAAWDAPPDLVLGQPDCRSNDPGSGLGELSWPGAASIAAGILAVADTNNDRILIWLEPPASNAEPADVSISLAALPAPTSTRYGWPWGVWTDGTRLVATSTGPEGAILFWDALPESDDQRPSYAIDLPEMGTPRQISTDGSTWFLVGDHNASVPEKAASGTFFWNSYPTAADQPYDFFFQSWIQGVSLPDGRFFGIGHDAYVWDSVPRSESDLPASSFVPCSYRNLDGPSVAFAGGRLIVNNYNGNDVFFYDEVPDDSLDLPALILGAEQIDSDTLANDLAYLQNPVLATDGLRLVASSDFNRALWIWNSLPSSSGEAPDVRVSLEGGSLDFAPWDNALEGGRLVLAGQRKVAIWDALPLAGEGPSRVFTDRIGDVTFSDLKGVALDDRYFYLVEKDGVVHVWEGLPSTGEEGSIASIHVATTNCNRLNSDGTYLAVASTDGPAAVYVYRVADVATGAASPIRTITGLNRPYEAMTSGGALAVANTNGNAVHVWPDVETAGSVTDAVTLGQSSSESHVAAIGIASLYMPASLAAWGGKLWVGEYKFSSRIVEFGHGPRSYVFGAGDGELSIESAGDGESLRIHGYDTAQVSGSATGSDAVLAFDGSEDRIVLVGWFASGSHRLASISIVASDGTETSLDLSALFQTGNLLINGDASGRTGWLRSGNVVYATEGTNRYLSIREQGDSFWQQIAVSGLRGDVVLSGRFRTSDPTLGCGYPMAYCDELDVAGQRLSRRALYAARSGDWQSAALEFSLDPAAATLRFTVQSCTLLSSGARLQTSTPPAAEAHADDLGIRLR